MKTNQCSECANKKCRNRQFGSVCEFFCTEGEQITLTELIAERIKK